MASNSPCWYRQVHKNVLTYIWQLYLFQRSLPIPPLVSQTPSLIILNSTSSMMTSSTSSTSSELLIARKIWEILFIKTQDSGWFEPNALWSRQLQELLPHPPVLALLPLDHDEDHHGEDVEHDQEAGADSNGEVVSLSETAIIKNCSRTWRVELEDELVWAVSWWSNKTINLCSTKKLTLARSSQTMIKVNIHAS